MSRMVTDKNADDRRVERIRILMISSKILMKNLTHLRLFLNRNWGIDAHPCDPRFFKH